MARVGAVISTYGRKFELEVTLKSLLSITTSLEAIVICDSSPRPLAFEVQEICTNFQGRLPVTYVRSEIASLCVQKNTAIKKLLELCPNLDYVQVLDDDTMPEEDYIEKLVTLLDCHSDAIGASGMTTKNAPQQSFIERGYSLVYRLVGLESKLPGRVSRAGCGMPALPGLDAKIQQVQWLFGCSLWRSSIFGTLRYLDILPGSALFEDTEFSVRASKLGTLLVDPSAILNHAYSSVERPNLPLYAYRFSRNRWFVLRARGRLHVDGFWYWLSVIFLATLYLLSALRAKKSNDMSELFLACSATLTGAWDVLLKRPPK